MQETNPAFEISHYNYWLARVEMEMPAPDNRTLIELGKAAYVLSKLGLEREEV